MSRLTGSERAAIRHGVPTALARTLHHLAAVHALPYSLCLAVCEQESGFRNVWGHDPGKFRQEGPVTASGVREYFDRPRDERPNGIGPMQITNSALQHEAQRRGGLHDQLVTTRVGVEFLGQLVGRMGKHAGVRSYNGSGRAAELYADRVLARARYWHRVVAPHG